MKSVFTLIVLCICATSSLFADPNGKSGRLLSTSGGCGDCHGGAPSSLTKVTMTSKSGSFTVKPGAKTEFTAAVAHTSKSSAGINIGVKSAPNANTNSGTLEVIAGQGLKKSSSELVQSSPKSMTNGKAEFSFTWTAPTQEGIYYLMATGNAVNGNGGDSGDEWNFMTPIQLIVSSTTGIDDISENSQGSVHPNPILDYSVIEFNTLQSGMVSIMITNTLGQTMMNKQLGFVEKGNHLFGLHETYHALSPGQYFISIHSPSGKQSISFVKQ